jgi:hypothetical protein
MHTQAFIAVDFDNEIVVIIDYLYSLSTCLSTSLLAYQFHVLKLRSLETVTCFKVNVDDGSYYDSGHDNLFLMDKLLLKGRRYFGGLYVVDVCNWEEQQRTQVLSVGQRDDINNPLCIKTFDKRLAVTGLSDPPDIKVWTLEPDGASFVPEPTFTFRSRDADGWRALFMDSDQVIALKYDLDDDQGRQMNFRVNIFSLENGAELTLNLAPGIANFLPATKTFFLYRFNEDLMENRDDEDVTVVDLWDPSLEEKALEVEDLVNKWQICSNETKLFSYYR